MPCYDGRENERQVPVTDEDRARLFQTWNHNSPVAELLCWTLTNMEGPTKVKFLQANPKLAVWWAQHQERDRKKAQSERDAAQKKAHNSGLERQIRSLQRQLK